MTDAMIAGAKTTESSTQPDIWTLRFDARQSTLIHHFAEELAGIGGPQTSGARSKAALAATALKLSCSKQQSELLRAYSEGHVCVLIFEGLRKITDSPPPHELPNLRSLENRHEVLWLAARNQILLEFVDHKAFAYDMDNEGKMIRLVANFKGGGLTRIPEEPAHKEISSHSGLALGPHTEAAPTEYMLNQESAMIINNTRALLELVK